MEFREPGMPRRKEDWEWEDQAMSGEVTSDEILKSTLPLERKITILDILLKTREAERDKALQKVENQKEEISQLRTEVTTDPLTELLNTKYETHILESLLRELQYEGEEKRSPELLSVVVLNLDLNEFKQINDKLGHLTGDEALRALSKRLGEIARPRDYLFRRGGDEFLVVLPLWEGTKDGSVDPQSFANSMIGQIVEGLYAEKSIHGKKIKVPIRVSIGVSFARKGDKKTVDELLEEADQKMYEEKRKTRRPKGGRTGDTNQYNLPI